MSINRRPLRYAHSEGHTDICYTEDGRQMITCGNDGDIRIWAGIDDIDPESYCVGEGAFSVAQKGDDIYVCRDDGRVMVLKYPEGERNGTLTRFTAPATHITVAKNEPIIACVSEDCSVKIYNSPQDVDCTIFTDLKGPALGVAISSNEELLAVSSGDCNIYVWKFKEQQLVKTIECVPRCNIFTSAKVLGRMSFDPKSEFMAYPSGKEVIVVDTKDFNTQFTLKTDKVQTSYSIAQFSPCGNYIAASTTEGDICIWRCGCRSNSEPVISNHEQKYNVCALVWNPEEKGELSFCDVNGQVGTLEYTSGTGDETIFPEISVSNDTDINGIEFGDDDDDVEKLKNETLGLNPPSPNAGSSRSGSRAQSPERSRSPPVNLQAPFQPGSSPVHLSQRFMAFNNIGIVRHHTEEDDESSIDVQFHEASFFKSLYMKNHLNHTMASLSTAVLALACETPSKLVCIPLKAGVKEWTAELTDLEEILCISASSCIVAIATNCRMLRIFSAFGSQRAVLSIPGPVVSIASSKTYILVIYHACTAHSKDQNLSGMLIHLDGPEITNKIIPVPITPQSSLAWVGFTDVGSLATYDSVGLLRICRLNSGAWIPVADTSIHAKGASDSYFLISVSETSQDLRVIHCKGAIYPATTPLPIILELPMQVPLCEPETDKTQMEDKLFRLSVFETEQPEKAFKETAIKLFALACRNNLDDRAYELLEMLNTPNLVNFALKYANKLGRSRLVERLTTLLKKMQGEDTNIENNPNVSISRPVLNRRLKPKTQTSQLVESQPTCSPDIFTNTSITLDDSQSQLKDDHVIPKIVRNPFIIKATETKRNPLSLTNSNEDLDNTFPPTNNSTNTKPENTNPTTPGIKIEKETFTTWFNKEKPVIEKDHPELSPAEVVKFALKLFKKQAEKRKASDDGDTQKSKQAKLSAFAFSKS